MKIRLGYDIIFECPQPTPMLLTLNVHYSRVSDLSWPDQMIAEPAVPVRAYRDGFGNWCNRIVAPQGRLRITTNSEVIDSGMPDTLTPSALKVPVENLPADTLVYLLGSRYCETDRLMDIAWQLFGGFAPGWAQVQAVCDYVHNHIRFGYMHARATRTALEAWQERVGVCRDYAHLAIAFCRCLNYPTRYCTGYLGDIGVPVSNDPMDFSAWMEVFIGGQWHTFDARNNIPRIGRVLIARGRDASDVPISHSFGPNTLSQFLVWTDEIH
ncbi:MAG: transglutaminase family protein [Pseudomonadota bacterium]|nr:transglutaminase family protein [Pseudomonadota bacterium]